MIDFLVIGGGIAGTSVGARLAALGSVLVLERESALAYHASGRSAAMFEETYGSPSTRALNEASRDHHFTANGGVTTPIGVMPLRRSIARIAAPDHCDVSRWPMLFGPGETWYAKPDAGALIVSPADEEPSAPMDAWADNMVLAEGIARYDSHVTQPVTRMLSNWAGLRTFAPDRNLVLGPDVADASFIWMAGQGGYGFQTAPAASTVVADLVARKTPQIAADVLSHLSPARFS